MSMPSLTAMAGCSARKAALALHGLAATDREWILDRLDSPHRERLDRLLGDLRSTRLSEDQSWVRQILSEGQVSEAPRPGPRERLAAASGAAVWAVLRTEPPVLTRGLLATGPWPWEAQLRRHLSRVSNGDHPDSDQHRMAPALEEFLLAELADEVERRKELDASWPVRVARRLRQWR